MVCRLWNRFTARGGTRILQSKYPKPFKAFPRAPTTTKQSQRETPIPLPSPNQPFLPQNDGRGTAVAVVAVAAAARSRRRSRGSAPAAADASAAAAAAAAARGGRRPVGGRGGSPLPAAASVHHRPHLQRRPVHPARRGPHDQRRGRRPVLVLLERPHQGPPPPDAPSSPEAVPAVAAVSATAAAAAAVGHAGAEAAAAAAARGGLAACARAGRAIDGAGAGPDQVRRTGPPARARHHVQETPHGDAAAHGAVRAARGRGALPGGARGARRRYPQGLGPRLLQQLHPVTVLGGCQCDRIRVLGVPVLCTSAALDEEETFDSPAQGRLFRLHHGSGPGIPLDIIIVISNRASKRLDRQLGERYFSEYGEQLHHHIFPGIRGFCHQLPHLRIQSVPPRSLAASNNY
ncbi:hypothetical protein VPH35_115701 [Triticum aestivum]